MRIYLQASTAFQLSYYLSSKYAVNIYQSPSRFIIFLSVQNARILWVPIQHTIGTSEKE